MSASLPAPRFLAALLSAALLAGCGSQDSETLVNDARAALAAGDYKTAMIQLKNAVAEDEHNGRARYELGKLYLERLDLASAEKEFRRARDAGYAPDLIIPLIAHTLLAQREYQRVLDEIPLPPGRTSAAATVAAYRARAALGLERRDDARKTLQQAQQFAPTHPEVQLGLAHLALADKQHDAALQALDRALGVDARHLDSLLLKADLLNALGRTAEARSVYSSVVRTYPRHVGAHLALAQLAISDGALDTARKEIAAAAAVVPNHARVRYLQALVAFRENHAEQARDHLAAALKAAPEYVPALQLGGAVEFALGNFQTAEAHLNKVEKATPGNPVVLRMLAATQLRLGRVDDAARTLAPLLTGTTEDAAVLTLAGEIALAKRDFSAATAHLEKAAQYAPDNAAIRTQLGVARLAQGAPGAQADLEAAAAMPGAGERTHTFLILSQLEKKQFDAALASVDRLEKKQGASALVWNYRGVAQLGKGGTAAARASFGRALALDATFLPAATNLAQLDLQDKQPAAARQRYENVLKADPRQLGAMLALAELALHARDDAGYVRWLKKAADAHPEAPQPRVALARHLLAEGERNQALATAREAVNAQPDHPAALELLAATHLALKDYPNAIGTYRKLADKSPNRAVALVQLAGAQLAAGQRAEAEGALKEAVKLAPALVEAHVALARLEIDDATRLDVAAQRVRQIQQLQPAAAVGYGLEGELAMARRQFPPALAAYERAHALEPSGTWLTLQRRALAKLGRAEEGDRRLAAWVERNPQDNPTRLALAAHLLERNQPALAARHYLILNQRHPDDIVVLNNLAWALAEAGDPRASTFAERALQLQPDNPSILDTLGWIRVRQGQGQQAIPLLQRALSKAPDDPEIHWHLAAAYEKAGDYRRARSEIERLLTTRLTFPQENEARALLKVLQSKTP